MADCSRSECSGFYPIVTAGACIVMHRSCSIQMKSCASPICRAGLFPPFCFFFPPFTAFRDIVKSCIGLRCSKAETHCFLPLCYFSQDLILVQGIPGYCWVTIALVGCRNASHCVAALAFFLIPLSDLIDGFTPVIGWPLVDLLLPVTTSQMMERTGTFTFSYQRDIRKANTHWKAFVGNGDFVRA